MAETYHGVENGTKIFSDINVKQKVGRSTGVTASISDCTQIIVTSIQISSSLKNKR